MALTVDEVAELARNRMGWAPAEVPRLKTLVSGALESLGLKVARRTDFESLRSETPIAVVNGVVVLSPIANLLLQALPETGLLVVNGSVAKAAPSYHELAHKMPNDVYRWALRGGNIHVKDINTGLLGTVNQVGTLTYNRVPTLGDLVKPYDKELVDEVVLLASGKVEKSPADQSRDEGVSVNLNAVQ